MHARCSLWPLTGLEKEGRKNTMFQPRVENASSVGAWKPIDHAPYLPSKAPWQAPVLTPCLVHSIWLVRTAISEPRSKILSCSGCLSQANNAAVVSWVRNNWPPACNFGIAGGAPLFFAFLFLYFSWSKQVTHARAKAGRHCLLEGHQVALPSLGESSLPFANPLAFQIQATEGGEGGLQGLCQSLPWP